MPYVRAHTRRDGARVRGHFRRRRRGSVRRSVTRRRTGGRGVGGLDLLLGGLVLVLTVVAVRYVVGVVTRHPYWTGFLVTVVLAGAVAVLVAVAKGQARQRAEQAERDRLVAVTDTMSGAEFEQWFGRLLAASGFRDVTVVGGAGDRGADVTAIAPDGRRVVVQCKRQHLGNRVGSAAIQRFAGTCHRVHHGDLCMIVTNGCFTNGDGARFAHELGITLVDRRLLEA
ncbi:restriction endonuclease, partial [Micromonospora zhanjiangensis]